MIDLRVTKYMHPGDVVVLEYPNDEWVELKHNFTSRSFVISTSRGHFNLCASEDDVFDQIVYFPVVEVIKYFRRGCMFSRNLKKGSWLHFWSNTSD